MEPPVYLREELHPIWNEVVEQMPPGRTINPIRLEAYCEQIKILRDASLDVQSFGRTVEDATGRTVKNPAVDIIRDMHRALASWGNEFAPASKIRRRRGTMYDATRASVAAATHLKDKKEYGGAIEAACTLAWLIDEAQRTGIDELQRAAFGTIPTYLKACAALQITPAERPETGKKPAGGGRRDRLKALQGGLTG